MHRHDDPRHDHDLGLAHDLSRLQQQALERRTALRWLIGAGAMSLGGAGALSLVGCGGGGSSDSTTAASGSSGSSGSSSSGSTSTSCSVIPEETAGPYPGDGSNGPDVLEQSGVVRSDIRSSFGGATGKAEGVPMTLELTIQDLANGGSAFAGVAVYVWHCDRGGNYSLYSQSITSENYLRGVQIADSSGKVKFTSIFPACYSGRWPHIHFEVYPDQASITDSTKAIATSQVALPADVCKTVYATSGYEQSVNNLTQVSLTSDNVFGDDGGVKQLGTVSGSVSSGFAVSLNVPVDTTTKPSGGGAPPSR